MENHPDFIIEDGVLTKYSGPGGDVTVPEGVTEIAPMVFSRCMGLTSVVLPESLREIGVMAFGGCTDLISVTIPGRTNVLHKHCFSNIHPVLIAPRMPLTAFDDWNYFDACCGFARLYLEGAELDSEVRESYLEYIRGQSRGLGELYLKSAKERRWASFLEDINRQNRNIFRIAARHDELLRVMLAEKTLLREDMEPLLDECDKQNNVAAKAAVLEYAGRNLEPVDPTEEWQL